MYQWVIGLGNYPIGSLHKYDHTRHNTGGDLVLGLIHKLQLPGKGLVDYIHNHEVTKLGVVKGYINHSGIGIAKVVDLSCIDRLLVIHDDVELPYGDIRFKFGGSSKGHNGLRNITDVIGTDAYARLRIGVGKQSPLYEYVLTKHTIEEWEILQSNITYCYGFLNDLIHNNFKDKKNSG
jgi:peptidyl-tRNA hydrolase, PTH1 family